jgi:hypothetical protein
VGGQARVGLLANGLEANAHMHAEAGPGWALAAGPATRPS